MLGDVVKRLFNAAMFVLASLTFFLVPIGRKTSAQHLVAIFTTRPAREAGAAFSSAARGAAARAREEFAKLKGAPGSKSSGADIPTVPAVRPPADPNAER